MPASRIVQLAFTNTVIATYETNPGFARYWLQEIKVMMIYMLAIAMTLAMLIATAFGLHQEAERMRLQEKRINFRGFGPR